MKEINWDNQKNEWLKENRNISFEEITLLIASTHLIDVIESSTYKSQKIFVINIDDYIYLVPFVENESEIFLKTIFPSRKATKIYLGES